MAIHVTYKKYLYTTEIDEDQMKHIIVCQISRKNIIFNQYCEIYLSTSCNIQCALLQWC